MNEITIVKQKISVMRKMVDDTKVENDEDLANVSDKVKNIKFLGKYIEQEKEKYTEPAKKIIAEAREQYDPYIKDCKDAEMNLKEKAKVYMIAKESKRREDEKKIADRVERGTLKQETAMKKIEELPESTKTIRTDKNSGLTISKRKVAEIVEPNLIPDEYWEINEVRVRKDALEREKKGEPQIPGVVIREESDLKSI
jgi:hypothetical protein